MRNKSMLSMLALVPMIGLTAGTALAQPRPPAPPAAPAAAPGPNAGTPPRPMARFCEDAPARNAAKLAYLQEKLKLRADQQQAWTSFATQAKAAGEPMQKLCADMPVPPPPPAPGEARAPRPAPDASTMLAGREKMLTAHLESTRTLRAAVDALSPNLTPEQKEIFGKLVVRQMAFGHGGPRHHWGEKRHMREIRHEGRRGGDHDRRDGERRERGERSERGGPRDGGPRENVPAAR